MEVWKEIKGYEGFYLISNKGRVKSLDREAITKSGILKRTKGRLMSLTIKSNHYLSIMLCVGGKQKRFHVHRLVCHAFNDNPDNLPLVNHKDCDKKNNCYDNLEWCDYAGNTKHAMLNGLTPVGEKCYASKLTEAKVLAIRRLHRINPNFHKTNIAKKLGVRDTTIHKIINRQRWKHI